MGPYTAVRLVELSPLSQNIGSRMAPGFRTQATLMILQSLHRQHSGLHPTFGSEAGTIPICRCNASLRRTAYLPLQPFGPSAFCPTMASADSWAAVREPHDPLSPKSGTRPRPPEVSIIAFTAHLPDLQPWPLMDKDFVIHCPLVRPDLPRIRFLSVRSRLCSTLPSDPTSR